MGMKIPGSATGFDSGKVIEELMKRERIPVDSANRRKEQISEEKKEVEKLQTMLSELDTSLTKLKSKNDFFHMKVESSHPDILDGVVNNAAMLGNYELEVRGTARTEKELAAGFPDKDETAVGFGFLLVEREDAEPAEIIIEPGATLQQVANQINDSVSGVRAMVINTKADEDPFRLLVISEKSGKESRILIDPDTTFLEFKEQVTGKNLDVLFEDVPITDEDNVLEGLVEGVSLQVKRAEPGTKVQISVTHDIDATVEGLKAFIEKYNGVATFIHQQFQYNGDTKKSGILGGDGSLRMILRQLQSEIGNTVNSGGKFSTLADVGITTDAKTGELKMDESKVRSSLAEDYEGVAALFIKTNRFDGAADRLAAKLRGFRDPGSGIIRSRIRGLEKQIQNQDESIERQERMLEQKKEQLKQRFASLESLMANAQGQSQYLSQRFGGGGGGG
jgi:flagellar hook-associated protein 2